MKLFIKYKFSLKYPTWKLIKDKSLKLKIISKIPSSLKNYLGDIKSIKSSDTLEINSNNIMIHGSKNTLVLKTFSQKKKKDLNNQIIIYKKIIEKELPCPNIINTDRGYFFQLEKGDFGIALDFINGKYFNGAKSDLEKTANAISLCMNKLRTIKYDNLKVDKIFPSNSSELIEKFMVSISSKNCFSNKEKLFIRKNHKKILFIENEILNQMNTFKDIDYELLHRDLHPHNIIINKNDVSLMDIDSILPTKWPIAFGFAVFKLLRQFCVGNEFNSQNINLMRNFINSLVRMSEIYEKDYKVLFLGAKVEILRRILVIMEGNLNDNISPWNSVLGIQIKALSEVEYLENKLN